jgi:hypothetical protein
MRTQGVYTEAADKTADLNITAVDAAAGSSIYLSTHAHIGYVAPLQTTQKEGFKKRQNE